MRKTIFTLSVVAAVVLLLASCSKGEEKLFRVQVNGKYGFIDSVGNVVIEPQYKYVSSFTLDGYAYVISRMEVLSDSSLTATYGYINTENELVVDTVNKITIPFQELQYWGGAGLLTQASQFNDGSLDFRSSILEQLHLMEGLFVFQDEESQLFGYKGVDGSVKIKPAYSWCHPFRDGAAVVNDMKSVIQRGGELAEMVNSTGVIGTDGEYLIAPEYAIIQDYMKDGRTWALTANVGDDGMQNDWVLIDKKGTIITGPVRGVRWVYNSLEYPVCAVDMGFMGMFYSFLDENGSFLSDFNHDDMLSLAMTQEGQSEVFQNVTRFTNGIAGLKGGYNNEPAWFFVEKDFMILSEPYDSVLNFSEGMAAVKEMKMWNEHASHTGKWGFVRMEYPDTIISQAIPFTFSECGNFSRGLAYFMNKGNNFDLEGYIDKEGKIVWQAKRKKNGQTSGDI